LGKIIMCPGQPSLPSERLAAEIRRKIESAEWPGGDQIPSVTELAAAHGVSRATVVKAVRVLVDEGLVVTRQGWGTFVV
jgi:DNA-binding GntR family transcriptional regulator